MEAPLGGRAVFGGHRRGTGLLEVDFRDGLAKVVSWEPVKGIRLSTPAVLFLASDRAALFKEAEALVLAKGSPLVEAAGIPVLTDGVGKDADVPEGASCPSYLSDSIKDGPIRSGKDGRIMLVGPAIPKDVPDSVEIVVAGNIAEFLGDPKRLVPYMTALRGAIGYSRLIYAPGAGEPAHIALLSYLGVDIFGSIPLVLAARQGELLFCDGRHPAADAWKARLCHCPACTTLAKDGPEAAYNAALMHNYHAALQESRTVRHAVTMRSIRELVEGRVRCEPWLVASLRELDLRHFDAVERCLPINKPFLMACSRESLHRPEVARFQRRVKEWYSRPPAAPILLLLPCSARKPYSRSPTHRAISMAVDSSKAPFMVHKVVLTSPLGVVPMELEKFYPANCYDIAVTGDWDTPEVKMILDGLDLLIRNGSYSAVISYIGGMPFIEDLVRGHRRSLVLRPEDPRKKDELKGLTAAIDGMIEEIGRAGAGNEAIRRAQDMASFARFQFGPGGEGLVDRVAFQGGHLKLFKGGKHTGTVIEERGLISLTLDGGHIIKQLERYNVEIEDFEPTGSIFAVGIKDASAIIRPGDEVVVLRKGELAGVGVAVMGGPEMLEKRTGRRGAAVELRHRVKKKT